MHFFKVMMPGFRQKLKLPVSVCEELKRHKSGRVILESRLGKWKIKMCRNLENDRIHLNEGWSEFVDHHALSIGDFLVFEHTSNLHFNVSVFDSSACEKEYNDDDGDDDDGEEEEEENDDDDEAEEEEEESVNLINPPKNTSIAKIIEEAEKRSTCFVKTMVPHYATKRAKVCIPINFIRLHSLGKQSSATLRDPSGRAWPVKLTFQKGAIRTRMGGGWLDFYASNALKDGDLCVFNLQRRLVTPTTIFFDVHIFPADPS